MRDLGQDYDFLQKVEPVPQIQTGIVPEPAAVQAKADIPSVPTVPAAAPIELAEIDEEAISRAVTDELRELIQLEMKRRRDRALAAILISIALH